MIDSDDDDDVFYEMSSVALFIAKRFYEPPSTQGCGRVGILQNFSFLESLGGIHWTDLKYSHYLALSPVLFFHAGVLIHHFGGAVGFVPDPPWLSERSYSVWLLMLESCNAKVSSGTVPQCPVIWQQNQPHLTLYAFAPDFDCFSSGLLFSSLFVSWPSRSSSLSTSFGASPWI